MKNDGRMSSTVGPYFQSGPSLQELDRDRRGRLANVVHKSPQFHLQVLASDSSGNGNVGIIQEGVIISIFDMNCQTP